MTGSRARKGRTSSTTEPEVAFRPIEVPVPVHTSPVLVSEVTFDAPSGGTVVAPQTSEES